MSENILPEAFYEKFPEPALKTSLSRIWEQILKSWGKEEGIEYLNSLLLVEDGRSRQGFEADIMSELLLLEILHEQEFPEFPSSHRDANYSFANDHKPVVDF